MKTAIISDFLTKLKVWHKIEGKCIRTKRTCLKIPEINNKVAYFTGVITGDGSIINAKERLAATATEYRL